MTAIPTHLYEPDRTARPDHRGARPWVHCPLPYRNRVHEVPDTTEAQAEHQRRIGEDR